MRQLARLQTTPVKGLKLHYPTSVVLTPDGVAGDRQFYIIDEQDRLTNGRRLGPLSRVEAEYDPVGEVLALQFPGGERVVGRVVVTDSAVSTNFFDHDVAGHLVDGPWNDALTRYAARGLRLVSVDVPGTGIDLYPVTIVGSASIDALRGREAAAERLDHRRFRMLLEFTGCPPYEEDQWETKLLAIGSARIRVHGPVPRCVVTRQDPETGLSDYDTLQAIIASRAEADRPTFSSDGLTGIFFGRYGTVEVSGRVTLGDQLSLAN